MSRAAVIVLVGGLALLPPALSSPRAADDPAALRQQVVDAERAFARTMADRDHRAFQTFIADDAIFFSEKDVLRGRVAVIEGWKPLYDGPTAPFSWEPERVEVNDAGTLAFSSGSVRKPDGSVFGTFNSVWRLEADGRWRVIFDKGCPPCNSR
jgi:ketosteroid isomerase-like protein